MTLRLQDKSFPWGCAITSFAMVLDVPVQELVDEIGHDGSEIVFPHNQEPANHRGFHIQELIACCRRRGLSVTPVELIPVLCSGDGRPTDDVYPLIDDDGDGNWLRFINVVENHQGVLVGPGAHCHHACAFKQGWVYDPGKYIYNFSHAQCELRRFYPTTAWVIT